MLLGWLVLMGVVAMSGIALVLVDLGARLAGQSAQGGLRMAVRSTGQRWLYLAAAAGVLPAVVALLAG